MNLREHEEQLHRQILQLMAEHDMCRAAVGRAMGYHANSILYHMNKIQDETGLDPRTFYGLCKLLGYEKMEES